MWISDTWHKIFSKLENSEKEDFEVLIVGSPIRVDQMCTFGPKVHNLHYKNDSVTSRVLELELIPWFWDTYGPHWSSKKDLSMVAHQVHQ